MNILLCSAGRRPYLTRWFKEALDEVGVRGKVIIADMDPFSPARAVSDEFIQALPVSDESYENWLAKLLKEKEIGLAISINDFELSRWSKLPATQQWKALVRLNSEMQAVVEDKYRINQLLNNMGVKTPTTWLGTQVLEDPLTAGEYVIKGRFGSASRGLRFTSAENIASAMVNAASEVTTPLGESADSQTEYAFEDLLVVQEKIAGVEFGLDIISDLKGRFSGVQARRKISMRTGETDRAESVDSVAFEDLAARIAQAIGHSGIVDVDVIVDKYGVAHVIDINPRFGGGYPFSHIAGAKLPQAYIAWASDIPHNENWLKTTPGILGGKFVEVGKLL